LNRSSGGDKGGFDVFADDELKHHRSFEHPGHRRPGMLGDLLENGLLFLGDLVRPYFASRCSASAEESPSVV
jgi:hypothetical protein